MTLGLYFPCCLVLNIHFQLYTFVIIPYTTATCLPVALRPVVDHNGKPFSAPLAGGRPITKTYFRPEKSMTVIQAEDSNPCTRCTAHQGILTVACLVHEPCNRLNSARLTQMSLSKSQYRYKKLAPSYSTRVPLSSHNMKQLTMETIQTTTAVAPSLVYPCVAF